MHMAARGPVVVMATMVMAKATARRPIASSHRPLKQRPGGLHKEYLVSETLTPFCSLMTNQRTDRPPVQLQTPAVECRRMSITSASLPCWSLLPDWKGTMKTTSCAMHCSHLLHWGGGLCPTVTNPQCPPGGAGPNKHLVLLQIYNQ